MTTVSTDKARQGRRGQQVLYVLIASLLLVGLVFLGTEMYGESIDPPAPATENAPTQPDPAVPAQPAPTTTN